MTAVEKTTIKKNLIIKIWMFAPALQSAFQSSQVLFIYIALDAIDCFKASSFMVLNMKKM